MCIANSILAVRLAPSSSDTTRRTASRCGPTTSLAACRRHINCGQISGPAVGVAGLTQTTRSTPAHCTRGTRTRWPPDWATAHRSRRSCRPVRRSRAPTAPCRTAGCKAGSVRTARSGWASGRCRRRPRSDGPSGFENSSRTATFCGNRSASVSSSLWYFGWPVPRIAHCTSLVCTQRCMTSATRSSPF